MKNAIKKALIDVKSTNALSESDRQTLMEINSALEPVKLTVEALCAKNANLLTAETAGYFLYKKSNNGSVLSLQISSQLIIGIV